MKIRHRRARADFTEVPFNNIYDIIRLVNRFIFRFFRIMCELAYYAE